MKRAGKAAKILSFVVAVLMLVLLILQYQPFWTVGKETVSIAEFIWRPKEHKDFTKYFENFYSDVLHTSVKFSMNHINIAHISIFVCCIVGMILCCARPGKWIFYLLPIYGGIAGACGYAQSFIYQLGQNWVLHMILCILVAIVGGVGMVCSWLGSVRMD